MESYDRKGRIMSAGGASKDLLRRNSLGEIWRKPEFGLLLANLVVYFAVLFLDKDHNFRSVDSLQLIITQTTLLSIFAIGAALVIISGGIDLSVGSVIAFSSIIATTTIRLLATTAVKRLDPVGIHILLAAVAASILAGLLIGTFHALLITRLNLPPFIATLGTLIGLRSLGRIIAQFLFRSDKISLAVPDFRAIYNNTWKFNIAGFDLSIRWVPFLVFLLVAIGMSILMRRTVWGRHVYAMGGNEQAAKLSGIRIDRLKWSVYCLSASLGAIAGVLYAAMEGQGNSQTMGAGYELKAIAAAVVGGCSLRGGSGTIAGTILGALFLTLVVNGIPNVIKMDSSLYEGIIVGAVVILAVAVNQFRQKS